MGSETPITPVYVGRRSRRQGMERALWDEGVYALSIVYPTVAKGRARIEPCHPPPIPRRTLILRSRRSRRCGTGRL